MPLYCSVSHYFALFCIALRSIALRCDVLYCVVLYCVVFYNVQWYGMVLYCIVLSEIGGGNSLEFPTGNSSARGVKRCQ